MVSILSSVPTCIISVLVIGLVSALVDALVDALVSAHGTVTVDARYCSGWSSCSHSC